VPRSGRRTLPGSHLPDADTRRAMDIEGLRREIERRAATTVPFTDWDAFILGTSQNLTQTLMQAGAIATREAARWRLGRFQSIHLAIADAVFSKVRDYAVAVRDGVRPFAAAFAEIPLRQFAALEWPMVFERVFLHQPAPEFGPQPHHLSNEGRILTTVAGSRALLQLGFETAAQVREALTTAGGEDRIRRALGAVPGLGPALQAYTLMNLGRMTLKADRHVIRVVAPYLDLSPEASPADFEQCLGQVAPQLGRSFFEIDQILWYSEADGRRTGASKPAGLPTPVSARPPNPVARPAFPLPVHVPSRLPAGLLVAKVLDIQPNRDVPVLELRFAKEDAGLLPSRNRGAITVKIGNVRWQGTVGITGTNPPYVHANLRGGGTERSMTDLLRGLGVKEKGMLELRYVQPGEFELTRVLNPGQWRPGNDRGTRALW
jgi:hypothetical protein